MFGSGRYLFRYHGADGGGVIFPWEMSWLKATQKCVDMCSYVTLLQQHYFHRTHFFYLNAKNTFFTQEPIKLFYIDTFQVIKKLFYRSLYF